MDTTRAVVIPDIHTPLHDEPAIQCMLNAIEIVRPTYIICLGDIGEFEGASEWQWKRRKRPPLEFQLPEIDKDIKACNEMLDRIGETADKSGVKKKHFIQGNHSIWLDNVVEANPFLGRTSHKYGGGYLFRDSMSFKKRAWDYLPNNAMLKLGHLYFTHGNLFGGKNHDTTYLSKLGASVCYAHYHCCKQDSITHIGGEISSWCIGCLKRMDSEANKFLKGRPHNWSHAIAIVDYYGKKKMKFNLTVHRIIDGEVTIDGQYVNGN